MKNPIDRPTMVGLMISCLIFLIVTYYLSTHPEIPKEESLKFSIAAGIGVYIFTVIILTRLINEVFNGNKSERG